MAPAVVFKRRGSSSSLNAPSQQHFKPEQNLIIRRVTPHDTAASAASTPPTLENGRAAAGARLRAESTILTESEARWNNYRTRCLWGAIMLTLFVLLLMAGHLAVVLMVVALQTTIFREVVGIAYLKYRERKLAWFRTINWYFLMNAYYFLFGESLIQIFRDTVFSDAFLMPLATHHRFISFCLYMFGIILFVLNLKKGHYKFQFNQFGLTHMTILLVVCQAQFVIHNIIEGLFWFVLPVTLVICNDIMAYFFGFFFGKTPLIKLSPKKTWEGFLGAFASTIIIGFILSAILARLSYLTCPVSNFSQNALSGITCNPSYLFTPRVYRLPIVITGLLKLILRVRVREVVLYPIQLHSLSFSIFASLIAPFGGFFASGFKRAFKIKDFSDSIPGHGGLTDRMDCQFLMGLFVYVYYSSFLKSQPITMGQVLELAVSRLPEEDLRNLYLKLQEYLIGQDLLREG